MSSVFECTGHLCHAWIFIVMTCEIRLSAFILSQGTAVQMAWFQLKLSSALIKCHSRCNGSCNFQTKWLFVTCPCAFRLRNKFYRFYLRTQVSWIPTYIYKALPGTESVLRWFGHCTCIAGSGTGQLLHSNLLAKNLEFMELFYLNVTWAKI